MESETEEVRQVRRTALELLLSDHLGDCLAPCWFACPAQMDIPAMLRQIAAGAAARGDRHGETRHRPARRAGPGLSRAVRKGLPPRAADGAVAICELKRYVADVDLASGNPYMPACSPPTGKRVAIVGAGPTGLSAAYYLAPRRTRVTLFDAQPEPGGRLRA